MSSGSLQGNYQVTPKYPIVRAFSEDPIHLECLSKGFGQSPVQISVDNAAGNVTVSNRSIGNGVMTMLTAANPEISYVIRGKAACHTNNQLIKEWIYEIVPTPTLYLNNFEGEVSCLSPLTPKMVQTVRCINGMDCSFMGNQCLDNVTSCGFKKQKQFYANKDTNCWVEMLQEGINCTSVPYSHLNGLAQCTVNGLTKRWDYFVSLDFLRCTELNLTKELIKIWYISSYPCNHRVLQIATGQKLQNSNCFEWMKRPLYNTPMEVPASFAWQ